MSDYVILTDSSNDLTKDLRERFGIDDYFPGILEFPDGHQELSTLDWDDMSPAEFYGSMNKKNTYKTAVRGLGEQEAFFEKYLSQGYDILNLSLSSALSGTYSVCVSAAKNLQEKYPDRKIIVIDTLRYSGGAGLIASYAGEMKKAGKTIDEVAAWVEENKHRVHQMGTVDDLFFLKNMGRVSNMAAVMGSLINIKPLADFNEVGMNQVMGKAKGYKNMYKAVIEYMKKTIENPSEQRLFISCTNRKAQAMQLKEMVEKEFAPAEIISTTVCKANGAAIGPGMVDVFYLGTPITKNLEEETKILQEILNNL